ncbi:two-component regulator propeller domain-containing protein [Flagellimonas pacifica]|uniref:Ligand-binding sensor domain-containing protein n=1 Tax=Flagellimonas pacifica TaxID=1247520 RepID=A0A285MVV6_9FLAO|nr:two-component regulator propeller domain-containing protein [Allomuricauda parva]SNZ00813.1 ligand-binding sensor domain-containing protein [Allomuricauda parva]
MIKKAFNFFLFAFFPLFLQGQDYKFHHFTTVEGLPHNEVRKIAKDSTGFFWFGTQNGLSRYDGYKFKTYKHSSGDENTIAGDKIISLAASANHLWVGTLSGLSAIDTKTYKVKPLPKVTQKIGSAAIWMLFVDSNNNTWLSTEKGNYIIDNESLEIKEVLPEYNLACIGKGLKSILWIGTDKGMLKYDLNLRSVLNKYEMGSFSVFSLDDIYSDSDGATWATLNNNIFRYQPERDRFLNVYTSGSLNTISQFKESILFGSYGNGLVEYNKSTGEFATLRADPTDQFSISSNDIYQVFADNDNYVWVGTQEGLDYYDFSRHRFKSLRHLPGNSNSLRNNFVQSIYQDEENVFWIGTRSGIDRVLFYKGYIDSKVEHFVLEGAIFEELNNAYVTDIHKDTTEKMWFATLDEGLFSYDLKTNLLRRFVPNENDGLSIPSISVRSIMEDAKGRLWLGTGEGISLIHKNESTVSFENFQFPESEKDSTIIGDVFSIFQDSKKRIWVGHNNGGVGLLQEKNGEHSFKRFRHDSSNPKSLSNDAVFVIFEDSKQRIWFGTSENGLNLLMEPNGLEKDPLFFKRYTEADGLSDNEVNGLLEDKTGNLWIATNKGLSKFNVLEETFTNYVTYDGVSKGKFRKNACWKTKDGMLFFGGTSGINYFDPDNLEDSLMAPSPVFTSLSIDGNEIEVGEEMDNTVVLSQPLRKGAEIRLSGDENRFDLAFSALSYTSPLRNQYAYKLEGHDEEWKYVTGENPHVSYAKLTPGSYRFYLKTSNNYGVWSKEPIHLDFIVKASFYNSKLVKVGVFVLLAIAAFLAILVYLKTRKNKRLIKSGIKPRKKVVKTVDPEMDQENKNLVGRLNEEMQKNHMYLDPNLNLGQLAEKLDISANHLSMLLNDYVEKNFYDFINYYRVEEVKRRLANSSYDNQTILSIGVDCGFNSKSAFNRIFKNITGKTPSQYKNEVSRN